MGNSKVEINVNAICTELANTAFLREVDCIANNWIKIEYSTDYANWLIVRDWCDETFGNRFKVFGRYKYYFKEHQDAMWFMLMRP